MKNEEHWKPKRFTRDSRGRIIGTYNHKIIGNHYEPIIRNYSKGDLADIGCGDVPYYLFYKELVSSTTCIDWENIQLEKAYLDHVANLNEPMDFLESDRFDTVLCTDVLEHIHSPDVLFGEMARILKPGGHLVVAVPFLYWIHEEPHDYHRYTRYRLSKFCKDHGLEEVELSIYGGLPEVLFDLVHKGYRYFNFPLRKPFIKLFEALGFFLAKRGFVKRLSDNSRAYFPLGHVLVAKK